MRRPVSPEREVDRLLRRVGGGQQFSAEPSPSARCSPVRRRAPLLRTCARESRRERRRAETRRTGLTRLLRRRVRAGDVVGHLARRRRRVRRRLRVRLVRQEAAAELDSDDHVERGANSSSTIQWLRAKGEESEGRRV